MAIEQFEVDTAILRQSAGEVERKLADMQTKLKELTQKMEELDGMWDGPASETFRVQFTSDCAAFQEMCGVIRDFIDSVEYAAKEYDVCEGKVKSAVQAIQV